MPLRRRHRRLTPIARRAPLRILRIERNPDWQGLINSISGGWSVRSRPGRVRGESAGQRRDDLLSPTREENRFGHDGLIRVGRIGRFATAGPRVWRRGLQCEED